MFVKVVDASVMAAWCFREPGAAAALEMMRDTEMHAPLLLAYELTGIARRKAAAYPEKAAEISKALKTVLSLPIHWNEVDHPAVLRLALETNLTTYDASYLYLARKLGAPLATFDRRLAGAEGKGE